MTDVINEDTEVWKSKKLRVSRYITLRLVQLSGSIQLRGGRDIIK
jgi:hypothetical protein